MTKTEKLTFKLERENNEVKKMIFKAQHKTYDKAIKGDTMQSNMTLRQKLDGKVVLWGKQGISWRVAFSSQPLHPSLQLHRGT